MSPELATSVVALGIGVLFLFDRDRKSRLSWAVWLPMMWIILGSTRTVSQWFQMQPPDAAGAFLEGNAFDRNVLTGMLAVAVIILIRRRQRVAQLLRGNGPILLFLLYCGVSVLWSDFPDVAFKRWVKIVGDVTMVLIVLSERDPSAVLKFPARVGFLLIPGSLLMMRYYPELARSFDDITGEPTYTGVATSKNSLGMLCLVFGLGSVWRFLEAWRGGRAPGRTRRLLAHGAVVAMAIWLLVISHSMTSLSCFVLAVGLLVATSFAPLRRPALVHAMVACIVCASVSVLFLGVGGGVLESMGRDSSLTGRTGIWQLALGLTVNPIVGSGFESFWLGDRLQKMWQVYHGHINQAHNGYIEIYLNLGAIGIGLLLYVILSAYRRIVRGFRSDANLARFRVAYLVVSVIFNFTEGAFKMMSPVWLLLLFVAVAPATGGKSRARQAVAPGPYHTPAAPLCEEV